MKLKTPDPTKHKYLNMNDFQNPIQKIENSPIEQPHEISPIEKDKKRKSLAKSEIQILSTPFQTREHLKMI